MKGNNRIDALVPWSPRFYTGVPLFQPVLPLLQRLSHYRQWPGLNQLQLLLESCDRVVTGGGKPLQLVAQEERGERFRQQYAPRIFFQGELQTRDQNWHDLFQLLTWLTFPRTKVVINALHLSLAGERWLRPDQRGRRSPQENTLSLFDEGGAVILSSNVQLLQLITQFRWKELFWHRRQELLAELRCIPFGHALYEKGLRPYSGMTANTILLLAPAVVITATGEEQVAWVDARLSALIQSGRYASPRALSPFPILGMPGWIEANCDEHYYDDRTYFRSGRRGSQEREAFD
ncbi:MAG: DUF3025 domain-containing protein [Gammaproteobacteria bacterium]|nr:DUF3025 domain-containing protein [Gammaproteobacteria bacterium]